MADKKTSGKPEKKAVTCPVSRDQFRKGAKPVNVSINGVPMVAMVKEFESGSLGWYLGNKTIIEIDGVQVEATIGLNLIITKSKDLPK